MFPFLFCLLSLFHTVISLPLLFPPLSLIPPLFVASADFLFSPVVSSNSPLFPLLHLFPFSLSPQLFPHLSFLCFLYTFLLSSPCFLISFPPPKTCLVSSPLASSTCFLYSSLSLLPPILVTSTFFISFLPLFSLLPPSLPSLSCLLLFLTLPLHLLSSLLVSS